MKFEIGSTAWCWINKDHPSLCLVVDHREQETVGGYRWEQWDVLGEGVMHTVGERRLWPTREQALNHPLSGSLHDVLSVQPMTLKSLDFILVHSEIKYTAKEDDNE